MKSRIMLIQGPYWYLWVKISLNIGNKADLRQEQAVSTESAEKFAK